MDAGVVRPMRPDRLFKFVQTLCAGAAAPRRARSPWPTATPNETMIVDELGTLSYAEVHTRTNALAHSLSDLGIVEGDGVGIMCRNHRGFIESTFAVSKLGANSLYLNTAFAGPQLAEVVEREGRRRSSTTRSSPGCCPRRARGASGCRLARLRSTCDVPTIDELIAEGDPADVGAARREGRAVILTSGTTGSPKGASRGNPQSLDPAVALLRRSR